MNRSEKAQIVSSLTEHLQQAQSVFFTDFSRITVEEINTLRRDFFREGVSYVVVKNTLVARALETTSYSDALKPKLVGPTALALGIKDPIAPARILKKFIEKTNKLSVKACIFENQVFDGKQFEKIAALPSRPELIATILGSLNSPIANIVYVLDALEKKLQPAS